MKANNVANGTKRSEIKVLVLDRIPEVALEKLKDVAAVDIKLDLTEEEIIKIIAPYAALIVSNKKITRNVIEAAKELRMIGNVSLDCDNVDVSAATEKKIFVINAVDFSEKTSISYAEITISLIMALAKRVPQACVSTSTGVWTPENFGGEELYGKVLGVIGAGKVGRMVASRAAALGMKVIFYDPVVESMKGKILGNGFLSFDKVISQSDYLCLFTDCDKCLIDKEALAKMKPTVKIVNCYKAELIDEDALCEALNAGKIGGAALDVLKNSEDLKPGDKRLSTKNLIITPRLCLSNTELFVSASYEVVNCIKQGLQEVFPLRFVNQPELVDEEIKQVTEKSLEFGKSLTKFLNGKKPEEITVHLGGKFANELVGAMLIAAATRGCIEPSDKEINLRNVHSVAAENNIKLMVKMEPDNPKNEFGVEVRSGTVSVNMRGSVNKNENVVLTSFNDIPIRTKIGSSKDIMREDPLWNNTRANVLREYPEQFLFSRHSDVPGTLSGIMSLLDKAGARVKNYEAYRNEADGSSPETTAIFALDTRLPYDFLNEHRNVCNWSLFPL